MPTYPTFPQLDDSTMDQARETATERATNGMLRGRILGPVKRSFTLQHILNRADLATLTAFYSANAGADVALTYQGDGQAYTVAWFDPPTIKPMAFGRAHVTVKLVEV